MIPLITTSLLSLFSILHYPINALIPILNHIGITSAAELIDEQQYVETLSLDPDLYELMWSNYSLSYFLAVTAICLLFCIPSIILFINRRKAFKVDPNIKWELKTAYKKWAFWGFIGDHRFYLNSWVGLLYPVILSALIVKIAIDVMPNFYGLLPSDEIYISVLAWSVLRVFIGFWLFDAVWIRYRCYSQPYIILRQHEEQYLKELHKVLNTSICDTQEYFRISNGIDARWRRVNEVLKAEYKGSKDWSLSNSLWTNRADPWTEFERKRIIDLENIYLQALSIQRHFWSILASVRNNQMRKLIRYGEQSQALAQNLSSVIKLNENAAERPKISRNSDTLAIEISSFLSACISD
ncbi:MAG: hypothetical protein K2K97_01545 [Muribaculaceae bacterium]|nr:hypothetical protein [Muribaculaceae bacterium]